jgi:hypothetical protein
MELHYNCGHVGYVPMAQERQPTIVQKLARPCPLCRKSEESDDKRAVRQMSELGQRLAADRLTDDRHED